MSRVVGTERVLPLLLGDSTGELRPLWRALADFRQAVLIASDTPFYCFRAAEALPYCFGRGPKKLAWRLLCDSLRIDRKWIRRRLEIPSGEIRHGKLRLVTAEERRLSIESAATVIERFIALKQRGVSRLPEVEFPQLTLGPNEDEPGRDVDEDDSAGL